MKIKTIITILLTASLTLILFQNSGPISLKIFWAEFQISKLWLILAVFIVGLIVGLLWSGKREKRRLEKSIEDQDPQLSRNENRVLEEEDREWLSEE